jgi:hypothetical protein
MKDLVSFVIVALGENYPSCMAKASAMNSDSRRAPVPKVTDHIATPLRSRKNYVQVQIDRGSVQIDFYLIVAIAYISPFFERSSTKERSRHPPPPNLEIIVDRTRSFFQTIFLKQFFQTIFATILKFTMKQL